MTGRRRAAGPGTDLHLALGGMVVGLAGEDPRWRSVLARYEPFATSEPADVHVRLEATGPPLRDLPSVLALVAEEVTAEGGAGSLRIRSTSVAIAVDGAVGTLRAPLARQPVDLLVRALLANAVDRGLLVHGALVADEAGCWLCTGPSGSGKSTLARLAGAAARCDELAVVRRGPSGWEGAALPFWYGVPGGGPLTAVCLLAHGAGEHRARRLGETEALRRLVRELQWPWSGEDATALAFAELVALVRDVPVYELSFALRADVLAALPRGEAAA